MLPRIQFLLSEVVFGTCGISKNLARSYHKGRVSKF